MKIPDRLVILLFRFLTLAPLHNRQWEIKFKGMSFYFPPDDDQDLWHMYHFAPRMLYKPWPLNELLVLWPPKFPLFMADAHHPLVAEHYLRLNSHKDITTALCTLNSSDSARQSLEKHLRSRGICFPPHQDVFSTLRITNRDPRGYRYPEETRPGSGWQSAIDRINEILNCPAALANLRSLEVDIDFDYSEQAAKTFVGAVEVATVSVLLSQLINSAPKLGRLTWQAQCKSAHSFERDFELMGVRFERIRHLTLGPFSDFMVRFTPQLESLDTGESYYPSRCLWGENIFSDQDPAVWLLEAVEGLPDERRNMITRFSVEGFTYAWTLRIGYIKDIINAMPNLSELSLAGGLEGTSWAWDYAKLGRMKYMPGMEKALQSYLKVISHLPNLRTLKLPSAYSLGLGLDNSPKCGNIYDGPSGRAWGQMESQERAETVELAARFALQEMPYLSGLAVGGDKALSINATISCSRGMDATTDASKLPEVRWPWTGRMTEWTFEEWPVDAPGWW